MFLTISHKTTFGIFSESIYLSMNRGTRHYRRCEICNYDTFCEAPNVLPKWMVSREELSMFVERRILTPFPQPNEHQSCLTCWAWELSLSTPATKYPIWWEVMQGVVVPDIHFEVCLCRSVVGPNPFFSCLDQIIDQRLHVFAECYTRALGKVFSVFQLQFSSFQFKI